MAPRLSFSLVLLGGILLAGCEEMSTTGPSSIPSQNADADGLETALIPASAPQKTFLAYITGYTYWTNAPASSTAIAMPVIHRSAGGQGTYADPITLAVGRSKTGGKIKPDVPAGTRFYLERLQVYAIVEDVCGGGPCHTGYKGHPWFDVYVGGERTTAETAAACARSITRLQPVIMNPPPTFPVAAGELVESNCKAVAALD